MKNKVNAIIPARKGSKGIPGKNKRDFCGLPLVAWTIKSALKCNVIDRVYLTSDDQDVLDIGLNYGVQTYMRPKKLCEDRVNGWEIAMDIVNFYEFDDKDVVIYLQPTSPLKTAEDIEVTYYTFTMFNDCESAISCSRENKMYYGFKLNDGYLEPMFYMRHLESVRQELPEAFAPNGAIYVISVGSLKFYKSFYTPRTKAYVMPKERSVDLDEEVDWLLGEILWRAQND